MSDELKWNSALDVIYLGACALHGKDPDKKTVENMELEAVYKMAKFHSMQSAAFMALTGCSALVEEELWAKWKKSCDKAKNKILLFAVEREKLTRYFESEGIRYLFMKGIIMQDLYPKLGMRQMGDNDILIDADRRADVKAYFEANGYRVKEYGKESHDIYLKPPVLNFEIHVHLCNESVDPVIYNYYSNIEQMAEKDSGNKYGYHFSTEDFYVYMLAHAYKHYSHSGGVGFRVLQDMYVYLDKYQNVMDTEYLATELDKIKLTEFEAKMRILALKLFSADCVHAGLSPELLGPEDAELLDFLIGSGSYGVFSNTFSQRLRRFSDKDGELTRGVKAKYYLDRLFPTGVYIKDNYPFLHRHKYLLPFFWIYRFFYKVFTKSGKIVKEIRFINKQK